MAASSCATANSPYNHECGCRDAINRVHASGQCSPGWTRFIASLHFDPPLICSSSLSHLYTQKNRSLFHPPTIIPKILTLIRLLDTIKAAFAVLTRCMVSQVSQLLALEWGSMRGALRVYNQGTAPYGERDWRLPARKIDRVWRHKRGIPGAAAYLRAESCCESVFAAFHHGCADAEKLLPAFPARGTGGQRIRSSS